MANGIGRLRTLGIAAQPTFGTAATTASFVLPLLESATIDTVVNKIQNTSALGSAYRANEIVNTTRFAQTSLSFKLEEDTAPLLFKQRFTISSTTAAGESAVYEHTLSYSNNTNTWYTLFLQDSDRNSYVMRDVLFGSLNVTIDQEFVRVDAEAVGAFPVTGSVTNTIAQPNEFVGRHATFNYADQGSARSALGILNATLNHEFGRTDDGDNFNLGEDNGDLSTHRLTDDLFQSEVTLLESARTNWNEFRDNTNKEWDFTIESTDRFVSGSVASTRPYIQFVYGAGFIETWSEDAPLDQLIKETLTLTAVDQIGVSDAPAQIVVRNATASY